MQRCKSLVTMAVLTKTGKLVGDPVDRPTHAVAETGLAALDLVEDGDKGVKVEASAELGQMLRAMGQGPCPFLAPSSRLDPAGPGDSPTIVRAHAAATRQARAFARRRPAHGQTRVSRLDGRRQSPHENAAARPTYGDTYASSERDRANHEAPSKERRDGVRPQESSRTRQPAHTCDSARA